MPKKFLSECEAACLTGMSPDLLRWLTVNAPKLGVPRRGDLVRIDMRDYELIECPICEGKATATTAIAAPAEAVERSSGGAPKTSIRETITVDYHQLRFSVGISPLFSNH